MGRPAKTSDSDVLDIAYALAWQRGCDDVTIRDLEIALANELMNRPGARVFAAGDQGVETMPAGRRPSRNTQVVLWRAK